MAWQLILETISRRGKPYTRTVYSGSPGTAQDRLRQAVLKPGEKLTIVDDSGWPIQSRRGARK